MANPTPLSKNRRLNFDNGALEVDQIIVNGVTVLAEQQANVADPGAITAYSAADISAIYVEAEVQAIADALETLRDEVAAVRAQRVDALAVLEAHGLMADA